MVGALRGSHRTVTHWARAAPVGRSRRRCAQYGQTGSVGRSGRVAARLPPHCGSTAARYITGSISGRQSGVGGLIYRSCPGDWRSNTGVQVQISAGLLMETFVSGMSHSGVSQCRSGQVIATQKRLSRESQTIKSKQLNRVSSELHKDAITSVASLRHECIQPSPAG